MIEICWNMTVHSTNKLAITTPKDKNHFKLFPIQFSRQINLALMTSKPDVLVHANPQFPKHKHWIYTMRKELAKFQSRLHERISSHTPFPYPIASTTLNIWSQSQFHFSRLQEESTASGVWEVLREIMRVILCLFLPGGDCSYFLGSLCFCYLHLTKCATGGKQKV